MSSSSTDSIIERLGSKIVIASGNAHKIAEFQSLLKAPNRFVSQRELGVSDVPETGQSFLENALIKARHAAKETGLPALADDSGLVVAALSGAPGIYSARYAGPDATDQENCQQLLHAMAGKNRSCRFFSRNDCLLIARSGSRSCDRARPVARGDPDKGAGYARLRL